jgi:hypothetical protein
MRKNVLFLPFYLAMSKKSSNFAADFRLKEFFLGEEKAGICIAE